MKNLFQPDRDKFLYELMEDVSRGLSHRRGIRYRVVPQRRPAPRVFSLPVSIASLILAGAILRLGLEKLW